MVWEELRYFGRATAALVRSPGEGCERIVERMVERRERPLIPFVYETETEWEAKLHTVLGTEWPCAPRAEFDPIWRSIVTMLSSRSLAIGRGAYGGWDDADQAFARAVWCLVRHLRPSKVVETGVARGVTTRFVLEALERNRNGRLWSIDLPPLLEHTLREETAAAVPESSRGRWQYVEGSSRRRLPQLLSELGEIDLFIHDSMHTARNVLFEVNMAKAAMGSFGAVVVDDVHMNAAFRSYAGPTTLVCRSDDGAGAFGIVLLGLEAASQAHLR
jgi:hypothetical protein